MGRAGWARRGPGKAPTSGDQIWRGQKPVKTTTSRATEACSRPVDWKGPPGVEGPWITRLCVFLSALLPAQWLGWVLSRLFLLRILPKCRSRHTHTDPPLAGDESRSRHLIYWLPFPGGLSWEDAFTGMAVCGADLWRNRSWKEGAAQKEVPCCENQGLMGGLHSFPGPPCPGGPMGDLPFEGAWVVPVSTLTASAGAPWVQDTGEGKRWHWGGCSLTALTSILQSCPK